MSLFHQLSKLLDKSTFFKILSTTTLLLAVTSIEKNAQAATLSWQDLGWSAVQNNGKYDSTDSGTTFTNVDGSGVDVTVEYSDNMWNGDPNLYKNHPLGSTYNESLRFTNDTSGSIDKTWVKLTFSEAVYIDEMWLGSLSTLSNNRREWMSLSAYRDTSLQTGDLVSASKYDTYENFFGNRTGSISGNYNENADAPDLIGLDPTTEDRVYTTYGKGGQGNNTADDKFGRVFFKYADNAIKTLYIEHFVTQLDDSPSSDDSPSTRLTSVSIGNKIALRRATSVPEPGAMLGLLVIGTIGSFSLRSNGKLQNKYSCKNKLNR